MPGRRQFDPGTLGVLQGSLTEHGGTIRRPGALEFFIPAKREWFFHSLFGRFTEITASLFNSCAPQMDCPPPPDRSRRRKSAFPKRGPAPRRRTRSHASSARQTLPIPPVSNGGRPRALIRAQAALLHRILIISNSAPGGNGTRGMGYGQIRYFWFNSQGGAEHGNYLYISARCLLTRSTSPKSSCARRGKPPTSIWRSSTWSTPGKCCRSKKPMGSPCGRSRNPAAFPTRSIFPAYSRPPPAPPPAHMPGPSRRAGPAAQRIDPARRNSLPADGKPAVPSASRAF